MIKNGFIIFEFSDMFSVWFAAFKSVNETNFSLNLSLKVSKILKFGFFFVLLYFFWIGFKFVFGQEYQWTQLQPVSASKLAIKLSSEFFLSSLTLSPTESMISIWFSSGSGWGLSIPKSKGYFEVCLKQSWACMFGFGHKKSDLLKDFRIFLI